MYRLNTSNLNKYKIVMLSDYVDPATYTQEELIKEKAFINAIRGQIGKYSIPIDYIEVKTLRDIQTALAKYNKQKTVIFNWCETLDGTDTEATDVTKYLEKKYFIFTGANSSCLALTQQKDKTSDTLRQSGISVPAYQLLTNMQDVKKAAINFPLILKLNAFHSSVGITMANIVTNRKQLLQQTHKLLANYQTTVMAQEFIDGPEYTVAVWGNYPNEQALMIYKDKYADTKGCIVNTNNAKFDEKSEDAKNVTFIKINPENHNKTIEKIIKYVLNSYRTLGFRDYGRFEVRVSKKGCYVIDCNPNPWLGIDGIFIAGAKKYGYNYGEMIMQICDFAIERQEKYE